MSERKYPLAPRIGVGIVVLLNGKLLLVKRINAPSNNMWTLPGGLVELGETVEDAVKREALEEIGLSIEIDCLLDIVDFIERDQKSRIRYHYILLDYLTFAVSGRLRPGTDVSDIKLVNAKELANIKIPQITQAFLKKHIDEILPERNGSSFSAGHSLPHI